MKKKLLCLLFILMSSALNLNATEPVAPVLDIPNLQSPQFNHRFEHGVVNGYNFDYYNMCSVSYVLNGDRESPSHSLVVCPFGKPMKVEELAPIQTETRAGKTMYVHHMAINKDGRKYILKFVTLVGPDSKTVNQRMVLLDDKWNDIDPIAFGLDSYLMGQVNNFINKLDLPQDTKDKLLKALE